MSNATLSAPAFDVLCIGRAAVDLYGEQMGARLEDVTSFARYLGGSPANTAVGCARLGLRTAMLTRVGDEHNGRFVLEVLRREGVDVSQVRADPQRLTALVFLAIRSRDALPLLFYRDRCADMALSEADVDAGFVAQAAAVLISGTHLSQPVPAGACRAAIRAARAAGRRVVLDIDYRPVLWGLRPLGDGETRYVAAPEVSAALEAVLPECDLVVGTEEEIRIAGGHTDIDEALRAVQARTKAVIVVKRGSRGCRVHAAAEGRDALALAVDGFAVDVFNVLGAGDAFMAGFLDGWLRGAPLLECARRANACGALVVSRHGCAPAMPSAIELEHFLHHGSAHHRLRDDPVLAHLHRVTTRAPAPQRLAVLAFDHRTQLEELAAQCGAPPRRIEDFKRVIALAAARVGPGPHARGDGARDIRGGLILDDRYGAELLPELDDAGWWIARPVEAPGSRPLRFERDRDLHAWLREWPSRHVAKCLIALDPADPSALIADQLDRLRELVCACITTQRELLLEVIPPQWETRPDRDAAVHGAIEVITRAGVRPDWWKLPPAADERGWSALQRVITAADPYCRGVLVLGLDAPIDELESQLAGCAAQPICRGFAVGRSIFGDAARAWFLGQIGEAEAIDSIARRYLLLLERFGHAAAARGAVAAVASDAPVPSLQLRPA